ncbi:hypothetical protein GCM10027162_32930 [Streptomyces incanus]
MPIDLVPDFIPVLGYADDAIVVAAVLCFVVRHAGADALARHWPGTDNGLTAVRRLTGLPPPRPMSTAVEDAPDPPEGGRGGVRHGRAVGGVLLPPVFVAAFGTRDAIAVLTVAQPAGNGSRVWFNRREADQRLVGILPSALSRPPQRAHGCSPPLRPSPQSSACLAGTAPGAVGQQAQPVEADDDGGALVPGDTEGRRQGAGRVPEKTLASWVSRARRTGRDGAGQAVESEELARLRREIAQLRKDDKELFMERDVLKRCMGAPRSSV